MTPTIKFRVAGEGESVASATMATAGGTRRLVSQAILVPVDFSEPARKALHYAVDFARTGGARIILLHVLSPQQAPVWRFDPVRAAWALDAQVQSDAEQQLVRLAGEVVPPGIPVETFVRFGPPSSVILEVAAQLGVNLIVLATHAHTWLVHLLLGSVAARVGRLAPCPVFVVREREQEWQLAPATASAA